MLSAIVLVLRDSAVAVTVASARCCVDCGRATRELHWLFDGSAVVHSSARVPSSYSAVHLAELPPSCPG